MTKNRALVCVGLVLAVAAATSQASYTAYVDPTIGPAFQEAQASAFQAASSGLTVIDFDDTPFGTQIVGDEWLAEGIEFFPPEGGLTVGFSNASVPHSNPHLLGSGASEVEGGEDIVFELSGPQNAVGFWLIDSEQTAPGFEETIEFFNSADELIVSIPMPSTGYYTETDETNFFIGLISSDPIARVEVHEAIFDGGTPGSPETIGVDDVQYGVPEPTTLSLLALGGLAMLRRRA